MKTACNKSCTWLLTALLLAACAPAAQTPAGPPASLWQGHSYDSVYTIEVDQPRALVDAPIAIRVTGLQPGQPVTLRATMAPSGRAWESWATFVADASGVVDVTQRAPAYGSYTAADPMGLFWAMAPARTASGQATGQNPLAPVAVTLTAEAAGRPVATRTVERLFYDAAQVTRRPIREAGVVGTLFTPKAAGPHPAVICLPGSEGGVPEGFAALLASHGFAALGLGVFGVEGLPKQLVEIPLESAKSALDWFRAQGEVGGGRVAVLGGSKGAELALLLAATYPADIGAVVAYKPSAVVWMGLPANPADNFRGPKSSWTRDGRPVPFVTGGFTFDLIKPVLRQPAALAASYQAGLKNAQAVAAAIIPVEQMEGAVLLISGGQDQLWPATAMAEMVMRRLDAHRFPFHHEHLAYADAGHGLSLPYLPTTTINRGPILMGGSPEATATGNADAWPKVLAFLAAHLR
jgi:dienelactone hydrolase